MQNVADRRLPAIGSISNVRLRKSALHQLFNNARKVHTSNIVLTIHPVNSYFYLNLKENIGMSIGKRVKAAREEKGLSQQELANAVGMKQPTLSALETGDANSTSKIASIARELGVNAYWLETGNGNKYLISEEEAATYQLSRVQIIDEDEDPVDDAVRIKRIKLQIKGGITGYEICQVNEEGHPVFLRRQWLKAKNLKPENLIAVHVYGTSMEPKLFDGDTVVIDMSDTEPHDGDVYAVNYEGEAVIKRLTRDAGKWWLDSDNPDKTRFQRKEISNNVCTIIGKAVYKMSERF